MSSTKTNVKSPFFRKLLLLYRDLRKTDSGFEAVLKLNIGGIKHIQTAVPVDSGSIKLRIVADNLFYNFYVGDTHLGCGQTKYLTSEVSGGFTGVVIGLYAVGGNTAEFENLAIDYREE